MPPPCRYCGWALSRGGGDRASGRDDEGAVFARHVALPRGPEREIVRERKRSYEVNGREGEALATIAAFRAVQASDVEEMLGRELGERSARRSSIHLQAAGLLARIPRRTLFAKVDVHDLHDAVEVPGHRSHVANAGFRCHGAQRAGHGARSIELSAGGSSDNLRSKATRAVTGKPRTIRGEDRKFLSVATVGASGGSSARR